MLIAAALLGPTQSFPCSSCNPPFFPPFFFLVHFLTFSCVWISGKGGVKEKAAGGKLLISCTLPAAKRVGMFTVIYYSYDLVNEISVNAASTCFLWCDPQYARERRVSQVGTENIFWFYMFPAWHSDTLRFLGFSFFFSFFFSFSFCFCYQAGQLEIVSPPSSPFLFLLQLHCFARTMNCKRKW